jgi:hypothetical protein
MLGNRLERRAAVFAQGHDLDIGPRPAQEGRELFTHEGFVFGDDAGCHFVA